MATKRGHAQWRAFSMEYEGTFGTAEDIGSGSFSENFISGEPFQVLIDTEDDTVVAKSLEEAAELQEMGRRMEGTHNARMTPHAAAFFIGNALGYVSTVAEPTSGSFYTHNITPTPKTKFNGTHGTSVTTITVDDSSGFPDSGNLLFLDGTTTAYAAKSLETTFNTVTQPHAGGADNAALYGVRHEAGSTLKSFTVLEELGHTRQREHTGVVVSSFYITCERKQFAIMEATMLGSGSFTYETAIARPTVISAEAPLKASGATVNIGGTWTGMTMSGGTNLDAVVNNFNWTYTNELEGDEAYLFNGATANVHARGRGDKIRSSQELSFDLEFANKTYLDYLTGGTEFAFQIQFTTSDSYQVDVVFPKCRMLDATISGGTGTMVEAHNVQVMEHAVYGSVDVIVINKQSEYLIDP